MNAKLKYKVTDLGSWHSVGDRFIINGLGNASIRICGKEFEEPLLVSESFRYIGESNGLLFCSKRPSDTLSILDDNGQFLKTLEQGSYATKTMGFNGSFYFQGRDSDNLKHWYCYDTSTNTLNIVFDNLKSDITYVRKSCIVVFSKSHLTLLGWNDSRIGKVKFEISKDKDLKLKSDIPSAYKYLDIGDDKLLIIYEWQQSMFLDIKKEKIVFNKAMAFLNVDTNKQSMSFYDQASDTIYSYSFEGHLLESFSVKEIDEIDAIQSSLTLMYLNEHLLVTTPDPNLLLINKSGKTVERYALPEELKSPFNDSPNMFLAGGDLLGFRGGGSAYSPFVVYELIR